MNIPAFLKKGDKVGIVAPAKFIDQEAYDAILKLIESKGYVPIRGETTFLEYGPFAGNDQERGSDLQSMLEDVAIKAIFCLRGGYGTIRIIEGIDFSRFQVNPKWIIGFSDITILHNHLSNLNIASLHGQMPLNFINRDKNEGLEFLFNTLKGEPLLYSFPSHELNRKGKAEGQLVGGNVAILCSLIGTPYDIGTNGKVLFIEEVGEYLYRFDRLMHHLKMSGKLDRLSGLIIGGLTGMKDNDPPFGQSEYEIIADLVKSYDYPIAFNFPAGHIKENYPLVLGETIELIVDQKGSSIHF